MNFYISMIGFQLSIMCLNAEFGNLALHKPTLSSSVYHELSDTANSVDGNRESDWRLDSCFAADFGDFIPWLMVDLQGFYKVTRVILVNRGDCCYQRLNDFTVETFLQHPFDSQAAVASRCSFYSGHPGAGEIVSLDCETIAIARYIRVKNSGEVMQVCEIEVYGEPAVPYWSEFHSTLNGRMEANHSLVVERRVLCAEICANSPTCIAFNFRLAISPECEIVTGDFVPAEQTIGWMFYERYAIDINCDF